MRTVLFVQGAAERAGAERVLGTLLRHLDRDAVRPVVAFAARGPFAREVRSLGVDVVELPEVPRLRRAWGAPGFVRRLAGAIRESRADVVQATGEKMSVYAGWASRAAGTPCVFWLHDSPGTGPAARAAQLAMAASPRTRVVACAGWLAEAFGRLGAEVIRNGIELAELPDPAPARGAVLAETGWPSDAVVVAHLARLEPWKGTDVFLRAAGRVAPRLPRARFLVVGGGAAEGAGRRFADSLPALAAEVGLGERVRFTGYRTDALELAAGSDLVVHASRRADPFPTVVLEGMALGRAVVATRTRGPEEQLTDGRDGVLVDPGDAGSLGEAIERLARSPELRRVMGAAARETAAQRFTAAGMADGFEALYRSLVPDPSEVPA